MNKEIRRDMAVYAFFIVASIVVYFWIIPSQVYLSGSAKAEAFSPDTFPRFVTIVLFLAAAGGLANCLRLDLKARRSAPAAVSAEDGADAAQGAKRRWVGVLIPYIVFLFVLLYGFLFAKIGFIAATAIVPPIILFIVRCRKWHYYLIYYVFATVLYLLFKFILLVPIR